MTQEEKDLLLKDLCARLPYGVMVSVQGGEFNSYKYPYQLTAISKFGLDSLCKVYHPIYTPLGSPNVEDIKPYLRPMSSMTEKEEKIFLKLARGIFITGTLINFPTLEDFLNKNHLDYRGLIGKGLAIEAPEGMYK